VPVKNETLKQKKWLKFPILNLPFMCSNITAAPAYVVHISHMIRYVRASCCDHDFYW